MSDPVADFFSGWSTYRAVIESDSMEHTAVYAGVHEILAERSEDFTLLDLGCGDSAGTATALPGTHIAHYVGVDLAEPALALAATNLTGIDVDLRVGDALETLESTSETFDVILAAFVLHHLDTNAKIRALEFARSRLRPGGELILIDVARLDGESRGDYLDRFEGIVQTWKVTDDVRTAVVAHARGYDFPEEISTEESWLADQGFSRVEVFYRGAADTQVGWRAAL